MLIHRESTTKQSAVSSKVRFGEWLIRRGLIDEEERRVALEQSVRANCRLGDVLVDMGLVPREDIEMEAMAHEHFRAFVTPPPA